MYLFIDEVQNCTDYEKAISSIHLNKMVDIYITGSKVDFVVSKNKQTEYYQVSASVLDGDTLTRELEPFKHIKDNYPKFLITMDNITSDHNVIKQLNIVNWLQRK